jgi:hypothetical protein
VPHLLVVDGKKSTGEPIYKSVLLVDGFKHGAQQILKHYLIGGPEPFVKVTGYVSRDLKVCGPGATQTLCLTPSWPNLGGSNVLPLFEIENGQLSIIRAQTILSRPNNDLGISNDTVLEGEIVDTKCYLGAMNPGQGKTHLSCAVRCISGGIMPSLVVKGGGVLPILLIGADGKALDLGVLERVGLPVKIKGKIANFYNWQVLRVDRFLPY